MATFLWPREGRRSSKTSHACRLYPRWLFHIVGNLKEKIKRIIQGRISYRHRHSHSHSHSYARLFLIPSSKPRTTSKFYPNISHANNNQKEEEAEEEEEEEEHTMIEHHGKWGLLLRRRKWRVPSIRRRGFPWRLSPRSHRRGAHVPKGHVAVNVGDQQDKFLMPVTFLNEPLFQGILKKSEEAFGFKHKGAISLPCEVPEFQDTINRLSPCHYYSRGQFALMHMDFVSRHGCDRRWSANFEVRPTTSLPPL